VEELYAQKPLNIKTHPDSSTPAIDSGFLSRHKLVITAPLKLGMQNVVMDIRISLVLDTLSRMLL
jgi:hypothetical protein